MKLLKEELRKQRERIKNMNQQPLQVPVSESQTSPEVDEITRYTEAVIACFERCKNSVSLIFFSIYVVETK